MNKSSKLRFLFVKYLQRQCSAEEVDQLVLLMQEPGAEDALKEEMELLWEEFENDKTQHVVDWQKMHDSFISSEKSADRLIHKATSRKKPIYYTAGIFIMLIIFFALYRLLDRRAELALLKTISKVTRLIINITTSSSIKVKPEPASPGSFALILTNKLIHLKNRQQSG